MSGRAGLLRAMIGGARLNLRLYKLPARGLIIHFYSIHVNVSHLRRVICLAAGLGEVTTNGDQSGWVVRGNRGSHYQW